MDPPTEPFPDRAGKVSLGGISRNPGSMIARGSTVVVRGGSPDVGNWLAQQSGQPCTDRLGRTRTVFGQPAIDDQCRGRGTNFSGIDWLFYQPRDCSPYAIDVIALSRCAQWQSLHHPERSGRC